MIIKNDEELQRAQIIISEFLARNSPIHAPVLEVAVNEAMNNGFHTYGQINLKLKRMGRKLIIRVKDDGQGFYAEAINAQQKTDMIEEEFGQMLEAEAGRGILLMKLFCDKVIYNAKGNEVLLMKKVS
ncbi:Sensory box protein (fragment) [Candidatus Desulfosporosinus infrequens]|uniref:Sensory box protein n=1 Tax=Candidatus Desulfosporosinus infrequens TaxID=2043169 RepID=A0A2U3LN23_9FIRM